MPNQCYRNFMATPPREPQILKRTLLKEEQPLREFSSQKELFCPDPFQSAPLLCIAQRYGNYDFGQTHTPLRQRLLRDNAETVLYIAILPFPLSLPLQSPKLIRRCPLTTLLHSSRLPHYSKFTQFWELILRAWAKISRFTNTQILIPLVKVIVSERLL